MKPERTILLRIIIALALNSLTILALSQDTLLLRNGASVPVKVLEVGVSEIRFRKTENPEGPVYTEPKSNILRIRYANGTTETFDTQVLPGVALEYQQLPRVSRSGGRYFLGTQLISEYDLQSELMRHDNPGINWHVQHARLYRGLQNIGWLGIPLIAAANYKLLEDMYGRGYGYPPGDQSYSKEKLLAGAAAICVTGAVCFKIMRTHHNNAAIRLYNNQ